MIAYYKTIDSKLTKLDAPEYGCWISVVAPTAQEVAILIEEFGLDRDFVRSSLDEEESSRVEREGSQTLIIVDTAVMARENDTDLFYTMPLGIIINEQYVFTISLRDNTIIEAVSSGSIRNLQTMHRTRFVFQMLMRITAGFVQYLKQIDKISQHIERQLSKAMKNQELVQILSLEKSLVYFSNSLKANHITLEKLLRGRFVKIYDEDQDLLEDVLIELKQAIEMTKIYTGILSVMVDAFASVIANNQNTVMWKLTVITIVMAIPTMVFSFYGMNTANLPIADTWFPTVVAVAGTAAVAFALLYNKRNRDK
ncbi:MAG: magnesium transporter CorA family protein [Ruminococcus sp.]|nr:magnesium transporter CorA family protein [Ruminococcus sp.]